MKCGFFKKDTTPPNDCYLAGNTKIRKCSGIDDPIFVRSLVFQEEGTAIFLCFDLEGMHTDLASEICAYVAEQTGCEPKDVFISCTHIHTGPIINPDFAPIAEYFRDYLKYFAAAAAQRAIANLKKASFFFARSELPGVAFVRRFRMKDGGVRTNPGRHNPDILEPMSPADETIQLLKIVQEGGNEIALVNFQVHPDVHGGTRISADYPAVLCATLEGALPGVNCFYMNGTAGDLNHVDVNCPEWDKNGGPEHALHMGRTIAGKVLSMYTKARPVATGPVRTAVQQVTLKLKVPEPERAAEAAQYMRWYEAGELDKIPHKGMELTTAIYEAKGILARLSGPTEQTVPVGCVAMGDFCVATIPGEGFCEIGRQIRENSPFAIQFISGITNGYEDYFPMKDAFEVNGYESRSSPFQPGVGEALMEAGKSLTQELFNNQSFIQEELL